MKLHPNNLNRAKNEINKLKGIIIMEGNEVNKKVNFYESTCVKFKISPSEI